MNRERRVLQVVGAADVRERAASRLRRRETRDQHHHVDVAAAGRNRFDDLLIEHALLRRPLHVDDRALTGDGDRLFERADAQVDVDGRDERSGQLDALAPDSGEAAQGERHRIGARPKIDDAVLAAAVGRRPSEPSRSERGSTPPP